ncbi:hypothetical protein AB1Y20_002976 [Prymnesium parvum]|uniref:Adenylate kinase n=1 Tax=Prymnesium parvum TaxID=97485 RepID=A0AB34JAH4_PRYPA
MLRLLVLSHALLRTGHASRDSRHRRGKEPRAREQWELAEGQHNIVLFGPPGVGKGSQSDGLVRRYGVCHVSTGELLRAEIEGGSALGKQVQQAIARGQLLPDWMMLRLVRRRINRDKRCQSHGWLLDGFPRTAGQALAMLSAGLVPHHIVTLNASSATLIARALGRAEIARRAGKAPRLDDNKETLLKRIAQYESNKAATLRVLSTFMHVNFIDGEPSREVVGEAIARTLKATEPSTV